MASTYKTPGVYVEEISTFPPSVAQVETAVPAFIGYTEKAELNGASLLNLPTRITSLLEFESYFGTAYTYAAGDLKIIADENNNYAVKSISYLNKVFRMHDSLRLFFDNGGGKCYIVAVNTFSATTLFSNGALTNSSELSNGLAEVEKFDEPTILLFPDAVELGEADFYALQQAAIAQAAKLQDRVALLDLKENLSTWNAARDDFRNNIGINDLKYGMAYTPWLYNSYSYDIDFNLFRNNVRNAADSSTLDLSAITSDNTLNSLVTALNTSNDDENTINTTITTLKTSAFGSIKDRYSKLKSDVLLASADPAAITAFNALVQMVRDLALSFPGLRTSSLKSDRLKQDLDSYGNDGVAGLKKYVTDLVLYEKNTDVDTLMTTTQTYSAFDGVPAAAPASWLGANTSAITPADPNVPNYGTGTDKATCVAAIGDLDKIFTGLYNVLYKVKGSGDTRKLLAQNTLYSSHTIIGNIVSAIQKNFSLTPPSGAVAGVYALVDNNRGVWKAPANVSISSVIGPSVLITNDTQDDLNVDVEAGKSINAIRAFTGKGTIIWGARTLAGNDNEWRYVPVRRFFNMVEESVKKASSQFVFEPNDANTWVKVKAMIENYLTILWRQGALAGAKPEQAFFVKIGLGETMTAIDILEGRMNVEIGMAAVRPAEFIILKFSHKMQES